MRQGGAGIPASRFKVGTRISRMQRISRIVPGVAISPRASRSTAVCSRGGEITPQGAIRRISYRKIRVATFLNLDASRDPGRWRHGSSQKRSSDLGRENGDLPPRVPRAVREKTVVVAARAPGADRHVAYSQISRAVSETRPEVDGRRNGDFFSSQQPVHVGAHFIALPADRRPEMNAQ